MAEFIFRGIDKKIGPSVNRKGLLIFLLKR